MLTKDSRDGWEAVAAAFAAVRSDIGSDIARQWARGLPPGGVVLDLGCGSGVPIASTLMDEGLTVFGIDASPTLVSMFRHDFAVRRQRVRPCRTATFSVGASTASWRSD